MERNKSAKSLQFMMNYQVCVCIYMCHACWLHVWRNLNLKSSLMRTYSTFFFFLSVSMRWSQDWSGISSPISITAPTYNTCSRYHGAHLGSRYRHLSAHWIKESTVTFNLCLAAPLRTNFGVIYLKRHVIHKVCNLSIISIFTNFEQNFAYWLAVPSTASSLKPTKMAS